LRAAIWRQLKQLGAIYLRDGVCVLPAEPSLRTRLAAVADKVRDFGGDATLAEHAELDAQTAQRVRQQSREARQLEYLAVRESSAALSTHIRLESRHRDLRPGELRDLASDLAKLRRWLAQISARDYFSADGAHAAGQAIDTCTEELTTARPSELVS
jgi:hypothetical protein